MLVIDSNNCSDSAIVNIDEPATLIASISDSTNTSCNGLCDGQAVATQTGGTAPYSYLWNDPLAQTNDTATALCIGTYQVLVTDSNGCVDSISVTITEPTLVTLTNDSVDASCNGLCDGQAIINVSGGVQPYTYLWNDTSAQTTSIATGLCAGIYQVLVIDSNGCIDSSIVNIDEPLVVSLLTDSIDVSCNGGCDGQAIETPLGETALFSYI